MTTLTTSGLTKSLLSDRIAELQTAWRTALGANIDVDPDSRDGQIIGALAEMFANLDDLISTVYNGLLPDGATGDFLARLVQLNGITKKVGAYSTATCAFYGTPGTVIPSTALIRCTTISDSTITWSPAANVTIGGGGSASATVTCSSLGDNSAPANTLTKIQTVISGWTSVTNPADATRGYAAETDERLRARRLRSVAIASQGTVDSVLAGLVNLDNVTQAVVWENPLDTSKTMPGGSLDPHSIYAIVDGGDSTQIAQQIYLRKSAGCGMMGDTSETVTDEQGHPHVINFARPSDVDVWLEIDVTKRAGWISGTETTIASTIVSASETIGAVPIGGDSNNEFAWSDVLKWIAGLNGFSVTAVRMGTAEHPSTPWQNVAIDFDAIARFDATRILVTAT